MIKMIHDKFDINTYTLYIIRIVNGDPNNLHIWLSTLSLSSLRVTPLASLCDDGSWTFFVLFSGVFPNSCSGPV